LASDLLRNTLPVEDRDGRGFLMPLIFTFWFMVAAYVIHVLDESLLGGSFVEKVRQHWWPEYSWTRFFWFNTGYFTVMIASVVAYDLLDAEWRSLNSSILTLALAFVSSTDWLRFSRLWVSFSARPVCAIRGSASRRPWHHPRFPAPPLWLD
jgi:hypothetical protein